MKECIFEFSELAEGYLHVTLVSKDGERTEQLVPFDLSVFKTADVEALRETARNIAAALGRNRLPAIKLLIRSERIFKAAISVPVLKKRLAEKLYKKEKKRKSVEGYTIKADMSAYAAGYVFNAYYIPSEIISSFKIIAKQLSSRLALVKPYGVFLSPSLHTTGEYVHFAIKQKSCTIIYKRNDELISSYDFAFDTARDITRRYLLIAAKHEFYNEDIRHTCYGISSDTEMDLELGYLRRAELDEWSENENEQES